MGENTKRVISTPPKFAVMMVPWSSPMTLERLWCCLEVGLHCKADHEIDIVMTPHQQELVLDFFQSGRQDVLEVLRTTCIEKGRASSADDTALVLNEIADGFGSYIQANIRVKAAIAKA